MQTVSPAVPTWQARRWLIQLARLGHAVKGVVYLLIGGLAFQAAQHGGGPSGKEGATREIGRQPFGEVWLIIVGAGLAGYALWRLVQAIADPDGDARGVAGWARRIGRACSGLVYGATALAAFQLALGAGHGAHDDAARTWVGRLLAQPFGSLVVIAIGAGIIAAGLAEAYSAATASFARELDASRMPATTWRWVRRFGRLGLAAHAVVLSIIGLFVIRAALEFNPRRVQGFGGALRQLQTEPHGALLLSIVAIGLAAYGVFMLICARYARLRPP